jgi:hypothetical protein
VVWEGSKDNYPDSPGRFASGRTRQLSHELLPAATRRENKELKTDAPSGHGLAAALALTKNIRTLRAMRAIPETDWKKLRALKTRALNDACARILDAVAQVVQNRDGREHEAYLALWELIQTQDDLIASMFDDFKRSTAFYRLAAWQRHGLVTESDLAWFTEETQATVKAINQNAR